MHSLVTVIFKDKAPITVELTSEQAMARDDAREWLLEKTTAERGYGARPLKRALTKYVEDELSEALIQGDISETGEIEVYCSDGRLRFRSAAFENLEGSLVEKK